MRAVGLDFEHRTLAEIDIPEPDRPLSPTQARLRVLEVGVCGTDRELARFRFGSPPEASSVLALGHEALAEVVETGAGVHRIAKGDLVVPMIRRSCVSSCRCCAKGRRDLCLTGGYKERGIFGLHGYFTDLAVDEEADLVVISPELASAAILIEPLSVVEKAIEAGLRAHPDVPATALVLGAGPVGILSALALLARGFAVRIHSLEAPDHPRARLAARTGAEYVERPGVSAADLVLEATGSPEAARDAMAWTAPNGVAVLLGANDFPHQFPGMRMVVENLTVLGIVNAGPGHFRAAVADLVRFDPAILNALIVRRPFLDWPVSIGSVPPEAKSVHVLPA